MVAKETFARFDHEVWVMLWQWAKRRHPHKDAYWANKIYFKTIGNCLLLLMKRGRRRSGFCLKPIPQSGGTSKSKLMLTRLTRNGTSIFELDGRESTALNGVAECEWFDASKPMLWGSLCVNIDVASIEETSHGIFKSSQGRYFKESFAS